MVKLTKSEIFEKTIITAIDSINLRRLMAIMPDELINDFSVVLMASQRRRFFYFRGKQIPVNSIVHAGNQGSILIISTEEAQKIFTEYNPINLDELNKLIETKLDITEFAAYDATIQTAINRKADASSVAGKLDKVDFEQYSEAINQVVDSKVNSNIFEDFVEGVNGSFSQLQNKINHKADISSVAGKLDKDVFEENKIINETLFNQKADKTYVDEQLAQKVGGGNLATIGDLAQDVKEALTGGSVAVVDRDAVTNVNIVTDAVNGRTVSFVETKELNIYNEADSVVGKQIGLTGEISDNVGAKLSGYIRVKPNTSYTINQTDRRQIVFFDSATESGYLSGITKTPSAGKFEFVTPSGCNYMRTSLTLTGTGRDILISETSNYTENYYPFNTELVTVKNMQNVFGKENIADNAINYQKTDFVIIGKNKFDKSTAVDGYISSELGSILTHATYNVSDFIPVSENTDYIISPKVRHFLAYDVNQNPIPNTYMSTETNDYTFNTGANIKFVRFNYYKTDHDIMQMEVGTTPTSYQRYGYEIPKLIHESEVALNNHLKDRVIFNIGDSIMAGGGNDGVGGIIASKNSMVVYDWSKGGATIAWDSEDASSSDEQTKRQNIQYQVQQAIASGHSPDYILFNGVTNDINGGSVVPLGEISTGYTATLDNTTFSGGFEKVVKDLRTAFPDANIIYIRPHIMESRNYENQVIYGNRALEICEKWSIFPVDLFKYSGLNTFLSVHHKYTIAKESFPDGDRTHPNQLGYEKYYVPHIETAMLAFV